jgi:anti-sigma28 factor (negative regulator of flagellin synthesis)
MGYIRSKTLRQGTAASRSSNETRTANEAPKMGMADGVRSADNNCENLGIPAEVAQMLRLVRLRIAITNGTYNVSSTALGDSLLRRSLNSRGSQQMYPV